MAVKSYRGGIKYGSLKGEYNVRTLYGSRKQAPVDSQWPEGEKRELVLFGKEKRSELSRTKRNPCSGEGKSP